MKKPNELPPEVHDLADEVGKFIRYWGFKKIHGRIWAHIFLSETPLDAGALMERLQVSKALMSLSLKDLVEYDVIFEAAKSARGTQTYKANPEVVSVILNVLRRREKKMLAHIETAHRLVKNLPAVEQQKAQLSNSKIAEMGELIDQAQSALNGILDLAELDLSVWSQLTEELPKIS